VTNDEGFYQLNAKLTALFEFHLHGLKYPTTLEHPVNENRREDGNQTLLHTKSIHRKKDRLP
jgi:hypothetical protein